MLQYRMGSLDNDQSNRLGEGPHWPNGQMKWWLHLKAPVQKKLGSCLELGSERVCLTQNRKSQLEKHPLSGRWSVISDLRCYYCNCFKAPQTIPHKIMNLINSVFWHTILLGGGWGVVPARESSFQKEQTSGWRLEAWVEQGKKVHFTRIAGSCSLYW